MTTTTIAASASDRSYHDALPMVAKLRHAPNWMRESYGSWKDCVLTYDRAPFEAADLLEALAKLKPHDPNRGRETGAGKWVTLNVPRDLYERLAATLPKEPA